MQQLDELTAVLKLHYSLSQTALCCEDILPRLVRFLGVYCLLGYHTLMPQCGALQYTLAKVKTPDNMLQVKADNDIYCNMASFLDSLVFLLLCCVH